MQKDYPDHHDAELVLKLYDLRREPVMRASRDAIVRQFLPRSAADVLAVAQREHPLNAAFRQVSTYWEMVFGMGRHGIIEPNFLAENSGEGLVVFAKIEPFLADYRATAGPRAFRNAEWMATECETGRQMFASVRERVARQRAGQA